MTDNNRLIKNFESELDKIADKKTKDWWENYVKHNTKFRGVGIPQIREKLKVWYKEKQINKLQPNEQLDLALSFFAETHAEDKLAGILFLQYYLYDKFDWKFLLKKFEKLFKNGYIYDWNICDWFCVRVLGPIIKENGMPCAKAISEWNNSKNVWQARCSIVAFANLTKQKKFTPMLLKSCSILIKRKERFAKTGVGWIIRELSQTDKRIVVDFINKNKIHFSKESLQNATKYFSQIEKQDLKVIFNTINEVKNYERKHFQKHMNTIAYFEIQAENPRKVVSFYKSVFGWNFVKDDLVPIEYYRMTKTSGILGAILKRPAKTPPPEYGTNAFTCSVEVRNFDETAEKIMENSGQVALPKFAIPGRCWQGYFIDIDHNVFGIFQVDANAK